MDAMGDEEDVMTSQGADELPEDLGAEIARIRKDFHTAIEALADAVDLRAKLQSLQLNGDTDSESRRSVADVQLPESVLADNVRTRQDLHDSIDALADKLELKAHVRYAAAMHAIRTERQRPNDARKPRRSQ